MRSLNPRLYLLVPLCVLYAACLTLASAPANAQLFAHLTLQSQPGDFIGQGGNFNIVYPSSEISAQIRRTLPGGDPAELLFDLGHVTPAPNTFALLFFGTDQLGIPIQPGTYGLPGNTAQRADFAQPGHAGLDVVFQNRGSNTLAGNFTITDVTFYKDAANVERIGSFAATFEQHSEGASPALFGTFTFNDSGLPTSVPEPSGLVLLAGALVPGGMLALRRRGSRL